MKNGQNKKPSTRQRSRHGVDDEEIKSSLAEPSLQSSSSSDSGGESDSDPEYSHTGTAISHDFREAAVNFARTHPEAYEVLRSESLGFTRLYSDIKRLKTLDQEPMKSLDKDLILEVFKLERKKLRLEMAGGNIHDQTQGHH